MDNKEDDRAVFKINAPMEAALLLTPAPMHALADELDIFSGLGPPFHDLNRGTGFLAKDDGAADGLRDALRPFNQLMDEVCDKMQDMFACITRTYEHDPGEWDVHYSPPVAEDMPAKLLDPEYQKELIGFARKAADYAAAAAKIVREQVFQLLPAIEGALRDYSKDYLLREEAKRRREASWIPTPLQDAFFGPIDLPWKTETVKGLPQRISRAASLLFRLPPFLDNVELLFRRLAAVDNLVLKSHGYSSLDDVKKLYQDRLVCLGLVNRLRASWSSADMAFSAGAFHGTEQLKIKQSMATDKAAKISWRLFEI